MKQLSSDAHNSILRDAYTVEALKRFDALFANWCMYMEHPSSCSIGDVNMYKSTYQCMSYLHLELDVV